MSRNCPDYGFNIRDLRRVIAVAEHRSLRRAALALEVDQGTLTRSIQALEHALRIPLFERMRTGARLTAAGVAFTKIAASVLEGMDEAMLHLLLRHNGVAGTLHLGVQVSFANGVVANLLEQYQAEYPDVDLQIMDGPRERLLRDVLGSRLDAAIDRLLALARHGDKILLVTEGATGIRMDGVVFRPIMDESGPATFDLALCWRDGESDPVLARFIELARQTQEDGVSFSRVGDV